jgi:PAS domain S-box-containing protein
MTSDEDLLTQLQARLAELENSEEQWRSLFAHAPNFIAVVDHEGVMKFLNRVQPGQVWNAATRPTIWDYMDRGYHDVARASLDKVFRAGETAAYQAEATGPHGGRAWYETCIGPVKVGGEIVAAALFSTDITSRKSAELAVRSSTVTLEEQVAARTAELLAINQQLCQEIQARQESHQELQAVYDGMVDGLLVAECNSKRFLRVNIAICKMLGYPQEELLELSVFDIHPPDELPRVVADFDRLAVGDIDVADSIPMMRKDGSVFHADVSTSRATYHGVPCMFGFFRDITERKQAAEALRHEHAVLRQLLRSQDRDRQVIAYEIHDGVAQTLAAAIMQFETFWRMCRETPKAAASSGIVVSDLLRNCHAEVRRLIAGLRPPILDEYGVMAALRNLVYESMARWDKQIEFHSDVKFKRLEPTLENALYRIAQESVSNACQHSDSRRVLLEVLQHNNSLRICVQDWGRGFDPDTMSEKCFGLAGIRERARLLGGQVQVISTIGEGSRIVVDLPLVPAANEP